MLIEGVKYACEACIKGHRQAHCAHADRPLREIQKRGRPATACEECREARKKNNCHRTCNHMTDEQKNDVGHPLIKTLPNGAKDLAAMALVRRPSSTRSRSSATSSVPPVSRVPSGTASTSIASEEELATIGRKKSVSRPPSSRRSSSAAQKKPHDLAHGHHADHPLHVSTAYSPYPHHSVKEHRASTPAVKTESPALPSSGVFAKPASLKAPTPPEVPLRSNSAPIVPAKATPPAPKTMSTAELAEAFFNRAFAEEAPSEYSSQHPLPSTSNAPAPRPATSAPTPAPQPILSQPAEGEDTVFSTSPDSAFAASNPFSLPPLPPAFSGPPPAFAGNASTKPDDEDDFRIDPAAMAFVLGNSTAAPSSRAALAPMYDEATAYYPDSELSLPADSAGAYYNFVVPTEPVKEDEQEQHTPASALISPASASLAPTPAAPTPSESVYPSANFPLDIPSLESSLSSLPPPNPAVYGYPLHPVDSHTSYTTSFSTSSSRGVAPSAYSGYESATGGAASALERLDLDLDPFSGHGSAGPGGASAYHSSSASSIAGVAPSGAAGTGGEDAMISQTDLDGILEWLASSAGAGVFPPSAGPSHHGTPSLPSTSAYPSDYAPSSGAGAPPSLSSFSSFSHPLSPLRRQSSIYASASSSSAAAAPHGHGQHFSSNPPSGPGSFSGFASSSRQSPVFPTSTFFNPAPLPPEMPPLRLPTPVEVTQAVDEAGYEEDDEAEEAEPHVRAARAAGFVESSATGGAGGGGGGGPSGGVNWQATVKPARQKRERNPALEMLRTATITCAGQAGVDEDEEVDSGEEEEDDEDAEEDADVHDSGEEDFLRSDFAARFGLNGASGAGLGLGGLADEPALGLVDEDDLERFGIDEDWLRRCGTGEVRLDDDDAGVKEERVEVDEPPDTGVRLRFGEDEVKVAVKEEDEGEERAEAGFRWWS
ncbi:hypothetical protein JCM8097_002322 [Rhodosporidiobolus ruineniae]